MEKERTSPAAGCVASYKFRLLGLSGLASARVHSHPKNRLQTAEPGCINGRTLADGFLQELRTAQAEHTASLGRAPRSMYDHP